MSDQELMAKITDICMLDLEHQAKVEQKSKKSSVSSVQSSSEGRSSAPTPTKSTKQKVDVSNKKSEVATVAQLSNLLTPLTTQVCELYGAVEKLTQGVMQQNPQAVQQPQIDENDDPFAGCGAIGFSQWNRPKGYTGKRGSGSWWPVPVGGIGGREAYDMGDGDEQIGARGGFTGGVSRGSYNFSGRGGGNNDRGGKSQGNNVTFGRGGFQNLGGRGTQGNYGARGSLNPAGRGGGANYVSQGSGGGYVGQGNFDGGRCSSCTQSKVLFCPHCKICFQMGHQAVECPNANVPSSALPKNE